jgi:peptide/nickel transport system permease protein
MRALLALMIVIAVSGSPAAWAAKDELTVAQGAPHLVAVPGLALALVTFDLNALGDALRDVLDPRG